MSIFKYSYFIFGRPFVKRFALCYRSVVCLSVCDVGVLWPNGWMDPDETWHGGRPRPHHSVLDGDPAPLPTKRHSPRFLAHVCFRKMTRWIKMSLGREVGLRPHHIVLHGDPAPPPHKRGQSPPNFGSMSIVAQRLDGSRCHLVWR